MVVIRFKEEQQFRQRWLWALLVPPMLIAPAAVGYSLFQQAFAGKRVEESTAALVMTFVGVLLLNLLILALMWFAKLTITVAHDGVHIRFRPFHRADRTIAFDEISDVKMRNYAPVMEYGGWGIKGSSENRAYNVMGNQGVQLVLADSRRVLLGSQRPAELENAIADALLSPRLGF